MPRFKLLIEYDGTPFVGWQLQEGGPSVQGLIGDAVAAFSGERVTIFGAGRTDAGVHALGQVAHFDLARDWRTDRVLRRLDAVAMHEAAQALVGRHDFTTFRAAECQAKSPVKTLDFFAVERSGEQIRISASARSFLHHQVRSMAGSLVLVGEGKWSAKNLAAALAARSRGACGPVAPPEGLYLVSVEY